MNASSKTIFLTLFISFFISSYLFSQEQNITSSSMKKEHITRVEGGLAVGGSGSVYFFAYNSGQYFQVSHGVRLNERSVISLAAAFESYSSGNLLPLSFYADRNFGKRSNQILKIHVGYSFGFANRANNNYQHKGGLAGGINYGWYLFKRPNVRMFTTFGYSFRRTVLVYSPFENRPQIRNRLDNHFLGINAGFEF